MAKLKFSKSALKSERDALSRYRRFLPTLELKKEQLVAEVRRIEKERAEITAREEALTKDLNDWVALFSEPVDLPSLVRVKAVKTKLGNIAGVPIPLYETTEFETRDYDLMDYPAWVDFGVAAVKDLASLQGQDRVLTEQQRLINAEMRVTVQRINLFDKVKIPECRSNIRKIQIFIGDQQASAVVRGKIAKKKSTQKGGLSA